jgi:hypothetical protein
MSLSEHAIKCCEDEHNKIGIAEGEEEAGVEV